MPLIKRYRSPQDIQQQAAQEKDPKPISLVGAERGGALIAFGSAMKGNDGSGR